MSPKLTLSAALSVLMMASFVLFGQTAIPQGEGSASLFSVPARVELPGLPLLPAFPSQR